jgi:RHS repeat-associated protein
MPSAVPCPAAAGGAGYRYGFNGKENDKDFGNAQLIQDYGFRLYNPAIGKFLSVDPLTESYPWFTPYQFAGNTPIQAIDLDGLENLHFTLSWDANGENPKLMLTSVESDIIPGFMSSVYVNGVYFSDYITPEAALSAGFRQFSNLTKKGFETLKRTTLEKREQDRQEIDEKFKVENLFNEGLQYSGRGRGKPTKAAAKASTTSAPAKQQPATTTPLASAAQTPAVPAKKPEPSQLAKGNQLHYDQENGGSGTGLPTQLKVLYPHTTFYFSRRGEQKVDVTVTGGTHPSKYPGSTWDPNNMFGDFKTVKDKKFSSEVKNGKLPADTQKLTYDPATGKLQ